MAETRLDPAAPPTIDLVELTADLDRLRSMVEQVDVEGARSFVNELEQRWPDSDQVRYWARVLAPPVARRRPGSTGRSLEQERKWLREHGHEYPGCWLAVLGNRLLAADANLGTVLAALRQIPGSEQALLHLQPGKVE